MTDLDTIRKRLKTAEANCGCTWEIGGLDEDAVCEHSGDHDEWQGHAKDLLAHIDALEAEHTCPKDMGDICAIHGQPSNF